MIPMMARGGKDDTLSLLIAGSAGRKRLSLDSASFDSMRFGDRLRSVLQARTPVNFDDSLKSG